MWRALLIGNNAAFYGKLFMSIAETGLWLKRVAALSRDGVAAMQTLDQGLASEAHKLFVGRLASQQK